ncbi:hypothetical protein PISMIDRAFT_531083 [Pisolithus microcarpus 441]|uniref:Unplaced genomic scaffold scaffold_607, whole genome shotgun sequence n=1 Tax=Pisolithus microcarpus 441 TaxID=765257 RepID=A0A0C9Y1R5_9AGAM|nr:hypothetical protein PISMIDRAFT_531083 [Pisolithus microcarpus 441]
MLKFYFEPNELQTTECICPEVTTAIPAWVGKVVVGELLYVEVALLATFQALVRKDAEVRTYKRMKGVRCCYRYKCDFHE